MPTPEPKLTPESRAITDAIARHRLVKAAIAEQLDISPGLVSQWAAGRTPVPAHTAPALAAILGYEPGKISAAYRAVDAAQADMPAQSGVLDNPQGQARVVALHADALRELSVVLAALLAVMKRHRPTEAKELVSMLHRQAPRSAAGESLIARLLAALAEK